MIVAVAIIVVLAGCSESLDIAGVDAASDSVADSADVAYADDSDSASEAMAEEPEAASRAASDDEADTEAEAEAAAADIDETDTADDAVDAVAVAPTEVPRPRPEAGLLTAADIDDNLNHGYFARLLSDWIREQGQTEPLVELDDRLTIDVVGANGVGIGNMAIEISDGTTSRTIVTTGAGRAHLYPHWLGLDAEQGLTATVGDQDVAVESSSTKPTVITIDGDTMPPSMLDLALVLDVTGSMSDELQYLTAEFESIVERVADDYGNVDMRFGLVVYRDTGEEFVTRTFDFTDRASQMRNWLGDQRADGGGDFPEAMDDALVDAESFSWRPGADVARVLILNADAPPHAQNIGRTLDSSRRLAEQGIRVYPLAGSGVDRSAEFLMRTMAATSGGRHMFLTGDSGIGADKLEPKAQCYVVTGLDDLLYRVLASELAGERIEPAERQIIRRVGSYARGLCL